MTFPARFSNLAAARSRFGDRIDRLGRHLTRVDELADRVVASFETLPPGRGWALFNEAASRGIAAVPDAPPALKDFFAQTEHVPVWVDWDILDRGGAALMRAGPLGGIVLGVQSLVLGYASPAGNKPLVFTGRLKEQAARRLNETARFVQVTCTKGALRPQAEGYQITLRVRLIHAQVRRMLLKSGRWDTARWGLPANQHDMIGTSLLFSIVVLRGLRQLGVYVGKRDGEAYMQLWKYSGYLSGVDPELLVSSENEAVRLGEMIQATMGEPDEDSRALTAALLESPLTGAKTPRQIRNATRQKQFAEAVCRELIGDELADKLGVEKTSWRLMVPVMRRFVRGMELVRTTVPAPFGADPARWAGERYWQRVVEVGLAGSLADFGLPQRLAA